MLSALAPSSRPYYSSIWARYLHHASLLSLPPVPPTKALIDSFLVSISSDPAHARSIFRVISVLKHFFATHDILWSPSPHSSLIVRGIAKTATPALPREREPFLPSHLSSLIRILHPPTPDDIHHLAAAALALYFALRPVELCSLLSSDLTISNDSLRLRFFRKKTRYSPVLETRLASSPCLLNLLRRYLTSCPPAPSGLLFGFSSPRQVNDFARRLSSVLASPHLRGHSFRIGCATALSLNGFPAVEIRAWGDWRSQAYLRYVRSARRHDNVHDPINFFPQFHHS